MTEFADTPVAASRAPYAVTPHNTDALPRVPKALYIGTGGNVVVRGSEASADVTFTNVPSGSYLIVQASHVRATGTTASGIVAMA